MNVALDKIDGRRGARRGLTGSVVDDFGFPDQPLLDEMTATALDRAEQASAKGFVLMVEGASIDKQAHNMDTERWMLDTIEFDRAVKVAQDYAREHGDTLVIVTADHECSGAALIGGSMVTDADLRRPRTSAKRHGKSCATRWSASTRRPGSRVTATRPTVIPEATDIDFRLLVGYGANADRYEDWRSNPHAAARPATTASCQESSR